MRIKKLRPLCIFVLASLITTGYAQTNVEKRVEDLLAKMTLEEKIGQMNQVSFFAVDDKAIAQYSDDDMNTFLARMGIAGGQGQKKPSEMTKQEKIALIRSEASKMLDKNFTQPIKEGKIGSLLNIVDPEMVNKLQAARNTNDYWSRCDTRIQDYISYSIGTGCIIQSSDCRRRCTRCRNRGTFNRS